MAAPAVHPAEVVDAYLQLCEDRDLEAAGRYLAPDVRLEFPGGEEYRSLAGKPTKEPYWKRTLVNTFVYRVDPDAAKLVTPAAVRRPLRACPVPARGRRPRRPVRCGWWCAAWRRRAPGGS